MAAISMASGSDAPNLQMSGGLTGILIPKTLAGPSRIASEILFAATETDPFPQGIEPAITSR
ncbi:MAG: hypothetical protein E5Y31_08775 [Mesorhizobium sp.]|nr:MAG: hypothetical protein E5Y31_08775 [Mesorhizobium sp.]